MHSINNVNLFHNIRINRFFTSKNTFFTRIMQLYKYVKNLDLIDFLQMKPYKFRLFIKNKI